MTTKLNINQEEERYEIGTWLRMLDYHQQENVYVKTRIAEIVKGTVTRETLERLEYYQSLFLNKDAVIVLLRREIAQLSDTIKNKETVEAALSLLRKDIQRMDQEFSTLRAEFNNYIRTAISS